MRPHMIGGRIDGHKFDHGQLRSMKSTCQQHCSSTLNHNLAYCYNSARVIKFVWTNLVTNRMQSGAHLGLSPRWKASEQQCNHQSER